MRLALAFFLASASCLSDPTDVRTTVEAADLAVEGERLVGTVTVHFESMAEEPLSLNDLRLQLTSATQRIGTIDVALPPDVDATFAPGAEHTVTFTLDDGGGWSSFCGAVSIQLNHHSTDASGKKSTSLGADLAIEVACP